MKKLLSIILSTIILLSVVPFSTAAVETNETTPTVQTEEITSPSDSTEPTTENTEPTTEQPTTKPTTTAPKTQITLKTTSANLYVANTFQISSVIKNQVGTVKYSSNNKKVATVDAKGKIKGVKKGSATITVTNNGASAKFTVKVINPKLSSTSITVVKGETVKVKITGKATPVKNKYKSTKYAKITTKSKNAKAITIKGLKATKKTTLKIRVNGVWLSLKVKVIAHEKLTYWLEAKTKKISLNLDELKLTTDIYDKYSIETNSYDLYNKKKITEKQHIKYMEGTVFAQSPKYTFSKKGIVKLKGTTITPVKVGKTNLTIKYGKATATIPIEVTKLTETTYEGKKSKGCYSYKEVYNFLKDSFYNYIVKGKEPKYYSATCFFYTKKGLEKTMYKYAEKEFDNGQNFLHFIKNGTEWFNDFCRWDESPDDKGYAYVVLRPTKKQLTNYKEIYDTANQILDDIHIDDLNTDVEKILALSKWINENCEYDLEYTGTGSEEYIIIDRKGVCENYTNATTYFCYLLNIPCDYVISDEYSKKYPWDELHAWNIVKINNKWYHLDILWKLHFLGNKDIVKHQYHEAYKFEHFDVTTEDKSLNIE